MTFVATAEAVVHVGATPVVADVDPTTLLLTPPPSPPVRTERTRAVIARAPLRPRRALRRTRGAGATTGWSSSRTPPRPISRTWRRRVRSAPSVTPRASASSRARTSGALGDGGMVHRRRPSARGRSRASSATTAARRSTSHDVVGWCSRLDGLQAAVLDVKLAHLAAVDRRRRASPPATASTLGDQLVPWEDGRRAPPARRARFGDRDAVQDAVAGRRHRHRRPLSDSAVAAAVAGPSGWSTPRPRPRPKVLSLPMDPLMDRRARSTTCAEHSRRARPRS